MSSRNRKRESRKGNFSGRRARQSQAAPTSSARSWQPRYERRLRTLFSDTQVEKRIVHAADDQETVLRAFQEDGWCRVIDDPLPPKPGGNPAQRLRNTVGNLNRGLLAGRGRFYTHNRCTAIRWELVDAEE
jgi:hypothetical protein